MRAVETSSSSTARKLGTGHQTVTPSACRVAARSGPALASCSEPTSSSAPFRNAAHISSTEMSKASEAPAYTRSAEVTPRTAASDRIWKQTFRWRITTPLGRPVEPEV